MRCPGRRARRLPAHPSGLIQEPPVYLVIEGTPFALARLHALDTDGCLGDGALVVEGEGSIAALRALDRRRPMAVLGRASLAKSPCLGLRIKVFNIERLESST